MAALWPEFAAAGKARPRSARSSPMLRGCPRSSARCGGRIWAMRGCSRGPRRAGADGAAGGALLPRGHLGLARGRAHPARDRGHGRRGRARALAGPLGLDLRIGLPAGRSAACADAASAAGCGVPSLSVLADEPDPRLELVYGNPRVPIDSWNDPDLCAIEAPAVTASRPPGRWPPSTAGSSAARWSPPRRSSAASSPLATARTRSRAGRCASARPGTSSSGRRASSAPRPMRSATRARAAGRTARGRRFAPGSRSCRPICAPPTPTGARPGCSRRCTRRCGA